MKWRIRLNGYLPGSPEIRGAAPEASGGGICRVAGMTPYMGLMTAERTAGLFACKRTHPCVAPFGAISVSDIALAANNDTDQALVHQQKARDGTILAEGLSIGRSTGGVRQSAYAHPAHHQ